MPPRFDPLAFAAPPSAPTKPRAQAPPATVLSVVVVNYRRRDDCISLCNQLDNSESFRLGQAEVIVVDNDDDPRPLRYWAAGRPGVHLRSLGRNRGFAHAVNEGCRIGHGEWLLFLNPDMNVPDEFADQALAAAERITAEDPNVGVIGFELCHADGSPQPSAGPFPSLGNVIGGMVRSRQTRRCRMQADAPSPVPWVTGCCLLVRRSCWMELGGFDEDFFLYYEDVDLCRRAQAIGWSVWHDPGLQVTHYHPLHLRDVPPPMRLITRHALLTYAAKHWPTWQFRLLARLVRAEAGCRRLWSRLRGRRPAGEYFQRLANVATELARGRSVRARATLLAAARALACDPLP